MKRALVLLIALCLVFCAPASAGDGAPRPALELQRSVSGAFAAPGGSVTLSYRVENTGNVPLTQIRLTDPLCGLIAEIDQLAPDEYRTYQVNVAVTQRCQSAPQAQWNYGKMHYERVLEGVEIAPAENAMRISIATDCSEAGAGGIVRLSAYLTNEGNTALHSLSLRDASLGDMGEISGEIAPGETLEWHKEIRLTDTVRFCITAEAESESGERVSAVSNEALVVLREDAGKTQLSISASSCSEAAPEGSAYVDIVIENSGGSAVSDVTVMERDSGVLRTLSSAAPGATCFRIEFPVEGECEAQFIAQFTSDAGERTTVLCAPVTLHGGEGQAHALLSGDPVQLGGSAYAVFMYSGIALLALLAVLFAVRQAGKVRRKRIAREKRARKMRLMRENARMNEEEWMQTREHRPVSLPAEKEKQK